MSMNTHMLTYMSSHMFMNTHMLTYMSSHMSMHMHIHTAAYTHVSLPMHNVGVYHVFAHVDIGYTFLHQPKVHCVHPRAASSPYMARRASRGPRMCRHAYRHAYRHVYRHVYTHVYTHVYRRVHRQASVRRVWMGVWTRVLGIACGQTFASATTVSSLSSHHSMPTLHLPDISTLAYFLFSYSA